MKIPYYLTALLAWSSIYALVEEPINEKESIAVAFSTTSHNRISIEKGSIEKIFGDEAYFNINIDRTTGNAFVSLTRPIPDPLMLTVVTSSGLIQDLSVTSREKTSEHLILKEVDSEADDLSLMTSNFHQPTVDLLNRILEGKIPLGYGQRPLHSEDTLLLPQPLATKAIEAFEGPFENIVVYKIKNIGKHPIVLSTDSLKTDKTFWAFLNAHELKPKEEVLCIISTQKSEG